MLNASKLIGAMLALISAAMSLNTQYRLVAATLILLLSCFVGIMLLSRQSRARFMRKPTMIALFGLAAIWFASLTSSAISGNAAANITSIVNLFALFTIGWAAEKVDPDTVFTSMSQTFAGIFFVTLSLYFAGVGVYSNLNDYAALLLLPLMSLSRQQSYKSLTLFIAAGAVAYILNARLVLVLVMLIWVFGLPIAQHKWAKATAASFTFAAIGANLFFTFNFSLVGNVLTTNRVLIWNQYGIAIEQRPWFGWGYISAERAQTIAENLSAFLGRGVNETYGTQSLYVRYLYENGWIGLSVVLLLFCIALCRADRFFYPLLVFMLAGLLESIKLGAPSIIGLPLTFVFFAAILQRHSVNRQPDLRAMSKAKKIRAAVPSG